jgi:hypothetical protein
MLSSVLFSREGNWGLERLSHMPRVMQQKSTAWIKCVYKAYVLNQEAGNFSNPFVSLSPTAPLSSQSHSQNDRLWFLAQFMDFWWELISMCYFTKQNIDIWSWSLFIGGAKLCDVGYSAASLASPTKHQQSFSRLWHTECSLRGTELLPAHTPLPHHWKPYILKTQERQTKE